MATFVYEGLNTARERRQGIVVAATRDEAVVIIKGLGLFPTLLREQKIEESGATGGVNRPAPKAVPKK